MSASKSIDAIVGVTAVAVAASFTAIVTRTSKTSPATRPDGVIVNAFDQGHFQEPQQNRSNAQHRSGSSRGSNEAVAMSNLTKLHDGGSAACNQQDIKPNILLQCQRDKHALNAAQQQR